MKRNFITAMTFALAVGGPVLAATNMPPGKTRAEVRAELDEAIRTGDMVIGKNQAIDEIGNASAEGRKFNEVYPHNYPPKPEVIAKTRAEVSAELDEAIRTGDMVIRNNEALDETGIASADGRKFNDLYPNSYPPKPEAISKTRAEVRAELDEAMRTGDMVIRKNEALDETGIASAEGRKFNEVYPVGYPVR